VAGSGDAVKVRFVGFLTIWIWPLPEDASKVALPE
jgi:hypothetical protein